MLARRHVLDRCTAVRTPLSCFGLALPFSWLLRGLMIKASRLTVVPPDPARGWAQTDPTPPKGCRYTSSSPQLWPDAYWAWSANRRTCVTPWYHAGLIEVWKNCDDPGPEASPTWDTLGAREGGVPVGTTAQCKELYHTRLRHACNMMMTRAACTLARLTRLRFLFFFGFL